MNHDVLIRMTLQADMDDVSPVAQLFINHHHVSTEILNTQSREIQIPMTLPAGNHLLKLIFSNKVYKNYPAGVDMAVKINSVKFQNLDDNFVYKGRYYPCYPEPWASEQKSTGMELHDSLITDYLGWNGTWQIDFQTPIYPWIHKTLNLGWLI